MIYSPSRFVFVHIPRTGGLSITQALAGRLLELGDATINLSGIGDHPGGWWRHGRACELTAHVPHWGGLWRWAVMRSPWEIIASFRRLIERDYARLQAAPPRLPASGRRYWQFLYASVRLSFADWIRWHFDYLGGCGFWRHWCCGPAGEDLGVECFRFEQLGERWPEICGRLGLAVAPLPHVNAVAGDVAWTPESIDLVGQLCADDVERFGFTPPELIPRGINRGAVGRGSRPAA